MKTVKTAHFPGLWEITIRRDIEGEILPIALEHPTEPLPFDELPKDIDTGINVELLIAYLRSGLPMTEYMRNWIADMLEDNPKTPLKLGLSDTKSTSSKKKQTRNNIVRRHAALFARKWMNKYKTDDKDAAVHETMQHYKIGKTTINNAIDDEKMKESVIGQLQVKRK